MLTVWTQVGVTDLASDFQPRRGSVSDNKLVPLMGLTKNLELTAFNL